MADQNTPNGGTPPAAPVTNPLMPSVAERLSVPASALGLETELPKELQIPARKNDLDPMIYPTGPTGPAATPPSGGATGPAATGPSVPPGATSPTGPAAPPPPPAPTGPAPTAPEPKVKIGDKEYTQKELEKILADRAQQNQQQPAQPQAPAPPTPPAPTKEQIAEAEKVWCDTFVKNESLAFPATEAELETLLGGGKEAVDYFTKKLTDVAARAVLLARKSIYAELNPQMQEFARQIAPLFQNHAQIERVATEQAFLQQFPEYQGRHLETARQVAEAIIARYPQHVAKMNQQQFLAAVNEQADKIIQAEYKNWNPNATDTWREAVKRGAAPATPPASAPQPPTPPAPAPAPQPDPWRQAPAANSPASTPAAPAADWNKSVARSLQD